MWSSYMPAEHVLRVVDAYGLCVVLSGHAVNKAQREGQTLQDAKGQRCY